MQRVENGQEYLSANPNYYLGPFQPIRPHVAYGHNGELHILGTFRAIVCDWHSHTANLSTFSLKT